MLFPTSLDNISEKEAFLDILVPHGEQQDVQESNYYVISNIILQQIEKITAQVVPGGNAKSEKVQKESIFFQMSPFILQQIGKSTAQVVPTVVPWKKSYLNKEHIPLLGDRTPVHISRVKFRPGAYPQVEGLVDKINEGISGCLHKVWGKLIKDTTAKKLEYSKETKKIRSVFEGETVRSQSPFCIRFPASLAYKLGFGEGAFDRYEYGSAFPFDIYTKWLNVEYWCPNVVDLYLNLKQKFVYCDLFDPQVVGSKALKLLRVIAMHPHRERQGGEGYWEPVRIQYVKMGKKYFDTLEIQINTPLGDFVPYNFGKTLFILHFRNIY